MLIIKSFFRKKNTKVFFLILLLVITLIFCLQSVINYVDERINEVYSDTHLVFMQYDLNHNMIIEKNENLQNINRVLTFDNIDIDGLTNLILSEFDLGKIIAYSSNDKNQLLDNSKVIISLDQINYINYEKKISDILNKDAVLRINEKDITLKVIKVISEKKNGIIISDDLFNKLTSDNDCTYVANIKNYKKADETVELLKKQTNGNLLILDESNNEASSFQNKLQRLLKYISNISNIILIMFFIIILVINKNIISDEKKGSILKYRLGYTSYKISGYILLNILAVQLIAIGMGVVIQGLFITIIQRCFNIEMYFSINYTIIKLLFYVDFLLIIVNHKFLPRKVVKICKKKGKHDCYIACNNNICCGNCNSKCKI